MQIFVIILFLVFLLCIFVKMSSIDEDTRTICNIGLILVAICTIGILMFSPSVEVNDHKVVNSFVLKEDAVYIKCEDGSTSTVSYSDLIDAEELEISDTSFEIIGKEYWDDTWTIKKAIVPQEVYDNLHIVIVNR